MDLDTLADLIEDPIRSTEATESEQILSQSGFTGDKLLFDFIMPGNIDQSSNIDHALALLEIAAVRQGYQLKIKTSKKKDPIAGLLSLFSGFIVAS